MRSVPLKWIEIAIKIAIEIQLEWPLQSDVVVDDKENNQAIFEYLFQVVAKNSMGFGPKSSEVKAKKSGIGETSNCLYISAQ